jgi:hypothetical protein
LEKRAEQVLPGSKGGGGVKEVMRGMGEMTQTMYALMNIRTKKNKEKHKKEI